MSDVSYTLWKTVVNNQANDYQLQINTDFSSSTWQANGHEIVQFPTQNEGILKLKLKFKAGTDNHIVHDFSVGNFPLNGIDEWTLEVEYEDENGVKIKDNGQTEQAEANAHPRPYEDAPFA